MKRQNSSHMYEPMPGNAGSHGCEHLADAQQRSTRKRLVRVFLCFPLVVLYMIVVFAVNMLVTLLLIFVVYDWGDCKNPHLNLPYMEQVCRDPTVKHGFLGWVAELLCDLVLVAAFEAFLPIGHFFAEWLADLRGHWRGTDRTVMIRSLDLLFAAIERLGFRACMAFIFVPQWRIPINERGMDYEAWDFCDFPIVSTWCHVQESNVITYERRLNIFEKMMKGPFIVAPVVAILMKVMVPKVAKSLYMCFERNGALYPFRWLFRLLATIFTYDGGRVGCLQFVSHGWPFHGWPFQEQPSAGDAAAIGWPFQEQPSAEEAATVDNEGNLELMRERAMEVLHQFALKEFENSSEVLEMQMSFLNVLFFGPVMPLGIIVTLIAKIVERPSNLVKLLFTRRRALPSRDEALRISFQRFVVGATISSFFWYMCLILTTYQEDVYRWWPFNVFISVVAQTVVILGFFAPGIVAELRRCCCRGPLSPCSDDLAGV